MRILHILDHSIPLQSGYTFRTAAILREQRKLGWETHHLTSCKQGNVMASKEEVNGLLFHRTEPIAKSINRLPILRECVQMAKVAAALLKLAKALKPDVLHAHSPVLNAIPAIWVGKRLGIPVVYEIRAFWEDAAVDHGTTHEGSLRYRLTRSLETWAIKRAAWVTTICDGLKQDIVARRASSSQVTIIPNAVDIDAFEMGGVADPNLKSSLGLDGCEVIGFVGSFYAYEGLDLLVSALPSMLKQKENIRLLLVGGGPQVDALKIQAARLGIADKVVFTGRVPHEQVNRYYDLIDVLAYPRHSMRLTELVTPLKPLEAMAQGRIFVASDVGGHKELISDGKTGFLFKAGSQDALAQSLMSVLDARSKWQSIRENGRHFVESVRNWKTSVANYQEIYSRLTAARKI